jgi:oligoribonuclease NrnB/cAMP/cGMP phosphodiesterase (DHH superfamily)
MLIIYHDDYDGVCSAAIAYRKFSKEAKLAPMNYNKAFPFNKVESDEKVWVLDYSVSDEDMNQLMNLTKNIGWIDHHKTSMQRYSDVPGIRNIEKACCELAWEFFNVGAPMSWAIKYIGDRDIWKWQYGDATRHFYNGLQMETDSMNPSASVWDVLLSIDKDDKLLDSMMQKGMAVEKYKFMMNQQLVEAWAYEVEFEDYNCLALNCSNTIDRLSNKMLEKGQQIAILYTFDGNRYTISLYTVDPLIDVEIIAKKYGGGGHHNAAGFVTDKLPFVIKAIAKMGISHE